MKSTIVSLAAAIAVGNVHATQSVFSINDDVLAFPQYRVTFPDAYVSTEDAEKKLGKLDTSATASEDRGKEVGQVHQTGNNGGQHSTSTGHDGRGVSYESMVLDGHQYLCSIPNVAPPANNESSTQATSLAEQQKELVRAADRGWELLKAMEGSCIYYMSGWWSYSFCYGEQITQFHQLTSGKGAPTYPPSEDPTTPSYVLGRFDRKEKIGGGEGAKAAKDQTGHGDATAANNPASSTLTALAELQTQGESRYLVQKLAGGTTCDLTGRERKIEVQFHCQELSTDRIWKIKEVNTCTYLIIIQTPRLCNDVAFQPPREDVAESISCQRVLGPDEVMEWQEQHEAHANKPSQKLVGASVEGRAIIGGVEVGAKQYVGTKGKVLEAGRVASDQQPEKVKILAKSEGGKVQRLSDKDLKKLDIDYNTMKSLEDELKALAGDKDWKLEIVDGPGQIRELRGIIDVDDEEEQEYFESKDKHKADKQSQQEPEKQQKQKQQQQQQQPPKGYDNDDGKVEEDEEEGSEETYKEEL